MVTVLQRHHRKMQMNRYRLHHSRKRSLTRHQQSRQKRCRNNRTQQLLKQNRLKQPGHRPKNQNRRNKRKHRHRLNREKNRKLPDQRINLIKRKNDKKAKKAKKDKKGFFSAVRDIFFESVEEEPEEAAGDELLSREEVPENPKDENERVLKEMYGADGEAKELKEKEAATEEGLFCKV